MYLHTCFGELVQHLPALRPIDNRLQLVSVQLARRLPALPTVDTRPQLCTCTHTRAGLLTAYRHCLPPTTSHGCARIPRQAGASLPVLPPLDKQPWDMYLYTCFGELAQPLPALRLIDNRLRLMSGELALHQPALPPVDNQPRMWTASAFLKLTTQVLHEYLSKLAQHLPVSPRARGKSKAEVCGHAPRLCSRRFAVARVNRTHARTRNRD